MNFPADIWPKVLSLMEGDMTATTINTWFDDATPVALDANRFVLHTPSNFKRDIIMARYLPVIQKALHELFSADFEVVVLGEGELEDFGKKKTDDVFLPGTEEYTFERFVVGASNKFAHAAAQAVAERPAQTYNPLFIYGESGLGKTHLLYAIAHKIHQNHPDYRIVYIKGDSFTNELIQAIREGRNPEFREKYRSADVFLMDDVQFIAGRESTQEEMFHTCLLYTSFPVVELHPAGGDQVGGLAPGQGEAGGGHRVQPQGADGVPDGSGLHRRGLQPVQGQRGALEFYTPRLLHVEYQKVGDLLQRQHVAAPVGHQQIAHLLPVQAQAKDGAKEIPVGKLLAAAPGAPQGADGTALPVPLPVLRLLPVGQEGAYGALRSLVPAEEEVAGMAAGIEQVFHTRPLLWG